MFGKLFKKADVKDYLLSLDPGLSYMLVLPRDTNQKEAQVIADFLREHNINFLLILSDDVKIIELS